MKIDGTAIALGIQQILANQVAILRKEEIIPHLAVILIGNDTSSQVYVGRKQKLGEKIGALVTLDQLRITTKKNTVFALINKLNNNPLVHGIIIKRPTGIIIEKSELDLSVDPKKDVDGFHPKSYFNPPVAEAVIRIIYSIFSQNNLKKKFTLNSKFLSWLSSKKILIIGRGETAGKPVSSYFSKLNIGHTIGHSKTKNLSQICRDSDIIVSCVGKSNIVRRDMLNDNSIVIGVGLHPENEKLQTDYNQEEIVKIAKYYTPVPGGVCPVNVACLFANLIRAVELNKHLSS